MTARGQRGFTLIELVITMVLASIVVGFMSLMMVAPVDSYFLQTQRTELNDSANQAMRLLARDIHKALPRSVRAGSSGSVLALELLLTRQGLRYRDATAGTPMTELNIAAAEQNFNVFGSFTDVAFAPLPTPLGHRLVVGYTGGDYPTVDTITPATAIVRVQRTPDEDLVSISAPATFPNASLSKTVFVLEGPVKYLCNTTPGVNTLTRYEGYAIAPTLVIGAPAGVPASVVAQDVTSCTVNFVLGNAQHGDLVLLQLTIARNGETVNLMHEVQVEALP